MYFVSCAVSLIVFISIKSCSCDVLVYTQATNQIIEEFQSLAARFGPSLPPTGLRVLAVGAEPADACSPIEEAPKSNFSFHGITPKFAAVVVRGTCSFADKVRHAQNASFDAVVVYNKNSNELEIMSAADDSDIFIPSVFVGQTAGQIILYDYMYLNGFALVLNDDFPFNINTHLIIPFCIVVGLCFVIMLSFMVARCVRERRRIMRYRLPTSSLKKLESRKYTKNEIYDTCAICLDDYEEGDRLRILPCRHAYHPKCIDVWLTKNRRVCPICKRKVYTIGERRRTRRRQSADSTSDSMSSFDPDDTTPLINNQDTSGNHGTFPENQEQDDVEPLEQGAEQGVVSDDEILDDRQTTNGRRFNPFDRVPNLPPQLLEELAAIGVGIEQPREESGWSRFKRFITSGFTTSEAPLIEEYTGDVDIIIRPGTSRSPLIGENTEDVDIIIRPNTNSSINNNTGNNILNANLSGSFREENEIPGPDSDDDEILDDRYRVPPRATRKHRSAPNIMTSDQPSTSHTSNGDRLGVAAIPNNQFDPSRSGRGNNFI